MYINSSPSLLLFPFWPSPIAVAPHVAATGVRPDLVAGGPADEVVVVEVPVTVLTSLGTRKTMGKPWENHRKTIGKPWKTMGKP